MNISIASYSNFDKMSPRLAIYLTLLNQYNDKNISIRFHHQVESKLNVFIFFIFMS